MEENILFKFESNNKLYFAENKNNKIVYYFLDDDKKVYNLSREEIDVCNSILNRIAPSNQVIKLMDYKLNNKKYEIFYDKNSHLKLSNPMDKDIARILCLINNQEDMQMITRINDIFCVSSYVENIPLNITMIISNSDIIYLPISVQLIKIIENKFKYVGGDFAYIKNISDNLIKKYIYIVK